LAILFQNTREDSVFTAYRSADGINWIKVGEDTIDMPAGVIVGLVVTSHNVDTICTASFSDVTIRQGKQILNMPRLSGDFDRSGFANVINVTSTPVTTEAFHPYTGLYGKSIIAQLEKPASFGGTTISIKFIPDDLSQTDELFQAGDLKIIQKGSRVSVMNAFGMVESQASLSKVSCNHVAVRIYPEGSDVYVNGEWIKLPSDQFNGFDTVKMGPYNGRVWDI
jgi:hypothetical protein